MERLKPFLSNIILYARSVAKWLVISAVVGVLGGLLGTAFHMGVEYATGLRVKLPFIIWLLPVCGLAITAIYQFLRTQGVGTNAVIDAVQKGEKIPILLIPAIFVSTILTHLCGGSAGREGAALQIGGDLGKHIAHMFRLDDKDTRMATLCGMSALFSALFGTPLTATLFALEVISVGVIYFAGLLPCLFASLVAFEVSLLMGVAPTHFAVIAPEATALNLAMTAVLALCCAMVCIVFCVAMRRTDQLAEKFIPNAYLRAFLGGCIIIALTYAVGCRDYNGAGMDIISAAITGGTAKPEAFILKIIFTAVTLGFGFKGGEVVPTFFVGAVFGCVMGPILGLPAGFSAALGLVSLFCGAVNCPISSMVLSIELFGADGLVCFAVACVVSYVFSGYRGLYSSQTILYSKLRAEFINVHTK